MLDFQEQAELVRRKKNEVEAEMASPEFLANPREMANLTRAYRRLERLDTLFEARKKAERRLAQARELAKDPDADMAEMARQEIEDNEANVAGLESQIRVALLPPDPNDEKNTILEIRAGTGGEEAALFAADLARMYQRYCETRNWKMRLISATQSDMGGFKEAIFSIEGERVYSCMKFESGTHRVQRVPVTEAQGRIHTSAVTVAVLPEAEEVEVEVRPDDLRIDTFHSGGHGGQSVNTTDSAIRITHLPTGLIVSCQDEKSQIKNRAKAMKVLLARLYDQEMRRQQNERSAARAGQVGSGDRSQRIRTYNFPDNRVTDHRVNFRSKSLDVIMQGDIGAMIEALIADEQARRLNEAAEEATAGLALS